MSSPTDRLSAALADRYRIERELGAGGMATVFLAEDLKHDRKVAIKVLKPELAAVLGAERFVVEIKTTAAMSHPHILPLFDSGTADGFLFYVMPYIQGETIREKLNRETQFGVDEAIRITREVADALDYAHRHGIIHRDIKPENVLLHDGRAMVMDFGIALAVSAAAGGRMTETGLSLGTPHYMSPEQATADRAITARSDVYSLASVAYEMLTGEPPHMGTSAQQIIMKIIAEPVKPASDLRKSIPPHVTAALATALEKLPADRFESAKAFADALGNAAFRTTMIGASTTSTRSRRAWYESPLPYAAALVLSLAAIVGLAMRRTASDTLPVRFVLKPPASGLYADRFRTTSIAADGRRVAFRARTGREQLIYVQDLGSLEAKALAGTEQARYFALSPDGKQLVYQNSVGGLRRVSIEGGTTANVSLPNGTAFLLPDGVTWSGDTIIASLGISGVIIRSETKGTSELVRVTRDGKGCDCVRSVVLGPDGKHLFMAGPSIYVVPITGGEVRDLGVPAEVVVAVQHDLITYVTAEGSLMAAHFDPKQFTIGPPVAIESQVTRGSVPSLAANGTVLLTRGAVESRLELVDERGVGTPVMDSMTAPKAIMFPRFSPDGKRIALTTPERADEVNTAPPNTVSIFDIASGTMTRLTTGFSADRQEWSADGRRVLFRRFEGGRESIWWQPFDRSEPATELQAILGEQRFVSEAMLSSDGAYLLFRSVGTKTGRDIWYRAMRGDTTPKPFEVTPFDEVMPRFSPDGRWIAYTSNESGTPEVFVRPFPGPGGRTQVSVGGGTEPVWARDGTRLFYVSAGDIIAAKLAAGPAFSIASRVKVVSADFQPGSIHANYDVAPDGHHFLMARTVGNSAEIVVVLNWLDEARRRLAH